MVRVLTVFAIAGLASATLLAASPESIARGQYLVEQVGKCTECHTPMGADGKPDDSKHLKGTTLTFQPTSEVPKWHKTSPDITSTSRLWERWGDEGSVKFFETGKNPRGGAADPPMPAYTLEHADAQAIVDYLKSLK